MPKKLVVPLAATLPWSRRAEPHHPMLFVRQQHLADENYDHRGR